MSKLLENTYRSVNIGLVNEFKIISDKLGLNVWDVIEAAKTKNFGYRSFNPGPGVEDIVYLLTLFIYLG